MELIIPTPPGFSFKRTVLSHGWYDLPPFYLDKPSWTLSRVLDLAQAAPIEVAIREGRNSIAANAPGRASKAQVGEIERTVRHMLRLDESFADFYTLASGHPDFSWIPIEGAGRLLRAPTVFEDLVKMICTTNCSWALTSKMINALVDSLGEPAKNGRKAFPTPEAMSQMHEKFYRDEVSAGYRAGYLKELACRVASKEIDVEAWLTSDLPSAELKKQIKRIKGAGDYVAENILKMLGHYDGMALDSWIRGRFSEVHGKGRPVSDKRIAKHYSKFGQWNGLALWCDMTKDWIMSEESLF
jgi:3-methyladenine DNA glycosylase/8-oxoguanine DNA glycosylase